MFFCQKSEEFQRDYMEKLVKRLARDGFNEEEIEEIIEQIPYEKMSNIPSLENIINGGELW